MIIKKLLQIELESLHYFENKSSCLQLHQFLVHLHHYMLAH